MGSAGEAMAEGTPETPEEAKKEEVVAGEGEEKKDVEAKVEVEEPDDTPVDLSEFWVKPDQFKGIHLLDEKHEKIEGAPNFRQITGFPVYGTGQPTEEGMVGILNKAKEGKDGAKIIWFSMREEPLAYINGLPYAPRNPETPHSNLMEKLDNEQVKKVNVHLAKVLKRRQKESGNSSIKIHQDKEYSENPMERVDVEETLTVQEDGIKDLESVYAYCREKCNVDLQVVRIPIVEDRMPPDYSFDAIVETLKNEPVATPCVFSCQMGKGRTTVGVVTACLIKEIQITKELRKMEELKLISTETLRDLIYEKFERMPDYPKTAEEEDPLAKGEFEVIKQLVGSTAGAGEAKRKMDIIIDKCSPPPKGNGIQNLRECIIETKWKYDVAPEDKQLAFKQMIINFIERYFYILSFATYALDLGFKEYSITFTEWIKQRPELITMATEGKDKLEWSRTVDASKLETLKALMADPNYKDNLNVIIRTIYDFAYMTYSDLPRGAIKNNSMKKLAATTLMEILPEEMQNMIMKKLDEDPTMTHDFLTIVGLVSYC